MVHKLLKSASAAFLGQIGRDILNGYSISSEVHQAETAIDFINMAWCDQNSQFIIKPK